ncbi:DNA replication regulator SLD3-domain-containing protein [Xylariomycetidae sp. FL2044]|nr:DNA replication regulator SLD3-domain-containing protein [Xylariomycetidae sp. FL2044]
MEELLKSSIVIKPHPPNLTIKPRSLQPLMLLPRQCLPLSALDLSSPFGHFVSSRFYESNIKILDLEERMGSGASVLLARLEADQSLYALERQKSGLYTLCRLGSWVDVEELAANATVSNASLIKKRPGLPTALSSDVPLTTPSLHHEDKKRRVAIEAIQSLVKKPARSRSSSTVLHCDSVSRPPTITADNIGSQSGNCSTIENLPVERQTDTQREAQKETQATTRPGSDETLPVQTANGIFDNLRTQYTDLLYHSRGSLAYFAKGPLSRARAAFHLNCDSNLEMNDLIDFLKSLVLKTHQIDKKYRETIPGIIAKMKTEFEDSEVEGAKPRKRKARKMKVGKDSLYPNEEEHLRKWWTVHKPKPKDDDDMTVFDPQVTKFQVSWLRSRETQLQMIIILEILALEPLRTPEDDKESQLPGMLAAQAPADKAKEPAISKRKKHDLPFLLEGHADRLCIWHTTALDDLALLNDSQATKGSEGQKTLPGSGDPLKDFCVDIIVPFFSARLPDQCDLINRKLGGPVLKSASKPKTKKLEDRSNPKLKSGIVKRTAPSKPKTLDKVLSRETERHRRSMSRGPSTAIALMRSASTPTIPLVKLEGSEAPALGSIPRVGSISREASQATSFGAFKRRSDENKAKKEAMVKAELQDAISGLRKPNRDVVGKAMAEADQRRATMSLSQLRKSKKPTQHTRFDNIIKATPVGYRFRDALAGSNDSQLNRLPGIGERDTQHVPSSASMIPSSASRKRSWEVVVEDDVLPALPRYQTSDDKIEATPARPSTLNRDFLSAPGPDDGVVLASSPVLCRKASQLTRLPAPRKLFGHCDSGIGMSSSPNGGLTDTPMKPRCAAGSLEAFVTVTPAKKRVLDRGTAITVEKEDAVAPMAAKSAGGKGERGKTTIFDRLGWNDEYDDELC